MKKFLSLLFFSLLFSAFSFAISVTNVSSGTNWSATTWSPSTPVAGDSVTIVAGTTIIVDLNTPVLKSVNVVGTLNFTTNNLSDLKISDGLTISGNGIVNNTGTIEHTNGGTNKYFNIPAGGTYIHNPFN